MTAPRVPAGVPVLAIVPAADPMAARMKPYFFDKLPAHPQSEYVEIGSSHVDTPEAGGAQAIAWIRKVTGQP